MGTAEPGKVMLSAPFFKEHLKYFSFKLAYKRIVPKNYYDDIKIVNYLLIFTIHREFKSS